MGIQFVKWNNNKDTRVFLFHDYILGMSFLLLLGFDLNLILQQGHVFSLVIKNNAQSEHHFWPIWYLKLFVNEVGLNLLHNPVHTCAIIRSIQKCI